MFRLLILCSALFCIMALGWQTSIEHVFARFKNKQFSHNARNETDEVLHAIYITPRLQGRLDVIFTGLQPLRSS